MVTLLVDEVGPSLAFYRDVLGFAEAYRTSLVDPVHVELELAGVRLALSARAAGEADHGLALPPGPPQAVVVLWCHDAGEAYDELVEAGAPSVSPPHDAGPNRVAFVSDPAGHLLQLVSRIDAA